MLTEKEIELITMTDSELHTLAVEESRGIYEQDYGFKT